MGWFLKYVPDPCSIVCRILTEVTFWRRIFLVAPVAVGLVADVFSLSTSLWLASATMGSGVVGFRMLSRNTR